MDETVLSFHTSAIMGGFLILCLFFIFLAAFKSLGKSGGKIFILLGMGSLVVSLMAQLVPYYSTTQLEAVADLSVSVAVFGLAACMSAFKRGFGMGQSLRLYFGIATVHALLILYLFLAWMLYDGLRTVVYSAGAVLVTLPLRLRDRSGDPKLKLLPFLDLLLVGFMVTNFARLVLAAFDPFNNLFVPMWIDNIIYLFAIVAGVGCLVMFILLLAEQARTSAIMDRPIKSLAESGLSSQESCVIRLVLAGKSVKEIALETGKSESTVRNLLSRAYKKLGMSNQFELARAGNEVSFVE